MQPIDSLMQYPEQSITPVQSTNQIQQTPILSSTMQLSGVQPPNQSSTRQIIPVQPISITTPSTVLQPIVIPSISNSSLNSNQQEPSLSVEKSRASTTSQKITVNTSKLGDLYDLEYNI